MKTSLSRKDNHRRSLMRNMATSLVLYEEIQTTKAKAKALKPVLERLINLAKQDDLVTRRKLLGYFFDENATKKMFEVIAPRYKKMSSGYVNIYKIGPRQGDAAEVAIVKLKPVKEEKTPIKEENAKEKANAKEGTKESTKDSRKASAKEK